MSKTASRYRVKLLAFLGLALGWGHRTVAKRVHRLRHRCDINARAATDMGRAAGQVDGRV